MKSNNLLMYAGIAIAILLVYKYLNPSNQKPPKIMPFGDSITASPTGYRKKLKSLLPNAEFIGTQKDAIGNHEGHVSWSTTTMIASMPAFMKAFATGNNNVILIHIGTNDGANSNRSTENLNKLISLIPADVKIFLASVIPCRSDGTATLKQNIATFNAGIPAVITANKARKIWFVDMNREAGLIDSDYVDTLHPAQSGGDKMANVWWKYIKDKI